jgi:predicted nuclease with TOPRIM domain
LADRFNELEEELEEFEEIIALYNSGVSEYDTLEQFKDWYSDEYELYEELEKLRELQEDLSGADDDFEDGIILIAEENFTAYCKDLVEDIGDLPVLSTYVVVDIDWDATADNLRVDYSEVEFNGNTYLYR